MCTRWLAACLVLAGTTARAEPDGYRRGERGRPPGTTYVPVYGGVTIRVRGATIEAASDGERWECGGPPRETSDEDLVTVVLEISNRTREPMSTTALPTLDIVYFDGDEPHVNDGACVRDGAPLLEATIGKKQRQLVRRRFLVPRGKTPKILVYNDDDFPALFELPEPTRRKVAR